MRYYMNTIDNNNIHKELLDDEAIESASNVSNNVLDPEDSYYLNEIEKAYDTQEEIPQQQTISQKVSADIASTKPENIDSVDTVDQARYSKNLNSLESNEEVLSLLDTKYGKYSNTNATSPVNNNLVILGDSDFSQYETAADSYIEVFAIDFIDRERINDFSVREYRRQGYQSGFIDFLKSFGASFAGGVTKEISIAVNTLSNINFSALESLTKEQLDACQRLYYAEQDNVTYPGIEEDRLIANVPLNNPESVLSNKVFTPNYVFKQVVDSARLAKSIDGFFEFDASTHSENKAYVADAISNAKEDVAVRWGEALEDVLHGNKIAGVAKMVGTAASFALKTASNFVFNPTRFSAGVLEYVAEIVGQGLVFSALGVSSSGSYYFLRTATGAPNIIKAKALTNLLDNRESITHKKLRNSNYLALAAASLDLVGVDLNIKTLYKSYRESTGRMHPQQLSQLATEAAKRKKQKEYDAAFQAGLNPDPQKFKHTKADVKEFIDKYRKRESDNLLSAKLQDNVAKAKLSPEELQLALKTEQIESLKTGAKDTFKSASTDFIVSALQSVSEDSVLKDKLNTDNMLNAAVIGAITTGSIASFPATKSLLKYSVNKSKSGLSYITKLRKPKNAETSTESVDTSSTTTSKEEQADRDLAFFKANKLKELNAETFSKFAGIRVDVAVASALRNLDMTKSTKDNMDTIINANKLIKLKSKQFEEAKKSLDEVLKNRDSKDLDADAKVEFDKILANHDTLHDQITTAQKIISDIIDTLQNTNSLKNSINTIHTDILDKVQTEKKLTPAEETQLLFSMKVDYEKFSNDNKKKIYKNTKSKEIKKLIASHESNKRTLKQVHKDIVEGRRDKDSRVIFEGVIDHYNNFHKGNYSTKKQVLKRVKEFVQYQKAKYNTLSKAYDQYLKTGKTIKLNKEMFADNRTGYLLQTINEEIDLLQDTYNLLNESFKAYQDSDLGIREVTPHKSSRKAKQSTQSEVDRQTDSFESTINPEIVESNIEDIRESTIYDFYTKFGDTLITQDSEFPHLFYYPHGYQKNRVVKFNSVLGDSITLHIDNLDGQYRQAATMLRSFDHSKDALIDVHDVFELTVSQNHNHLEDSEILLTSESVLTTNLGRLNLATLYKDGSLTLYTTKRNKSNTHTVTAQVNLNSNLELSSGLMYDTKSKSLVNADLPKGTPENAANIATAMMLRYIEKHKDTTNYSDDSNNNNNNITLDTDNVGDDNVRNDQNAVSNNTVDNKLSSILDVSTSRKTKSAGKSNTTDSNNNASGSATVTQGNVSVIDSATQGNAKVDDSSQGSSSTSTSNSTSTSTSTSAELDSERVQSLTNSNITKHVSDLEPNQVLLGYDSKGNPLHFLDNRKVLSQDNFSLPQIVLGTKPSIIYDNADVPISQGNILYGTSREVVRNDDGFSLLRDGFVIIDNPNYVSREGDAFAVSPANNIWRNSNFSKWTEVKKTNENANDFNKVLDSANKIRDAHVLEQKGYIPKNKDNNYDRNALQIDRVGNFGNTRYHKYADNSVSYADSANVYSIDSAGNAYKRELADALSWQPITDLPELSTIKNIANSIVRSDVDNPAIQEYQDTKQRTNYSSRLKEHKDSIDSDVSSKSISSFNHKHKYVKRDNLASLLLYGNLLEGFSSHTNYEFNENTNILQKYFKVKDSSSKSLLQNTMFLASALEKEVFFDSSTNILANTFGENNLRFAHTSTAALIGLYKRLSYAANNLVIDANNPYKLNNLAHYLVDNDTGILNADVMLAITAASGHWLSTVATSTQRDTYIDVAIKVNIPPESLTNVELSKLSEYIPTGITTNPLLTILGSAVYRTLNISSYPEAPIDIESRLIKALGGLAVQSLVESKILKKVVVDPNEKRAGQFGNLSINNLLKSFYRPTIQNNIIVYTLADKVFESFHDLDSSNSFEVYNQMLQPNFDFTTFRDSIKNTPKYFQKLFTEMQTVRDLSYDSPQKVSNMLLHSNTKLSETQRKSLEIDSKKPFKINTRVMSFLSKLSPFELRSLFNAAQDTSYNLAVLQKAKESKASTLQREIDALFEQYRYSGDSDFYLAHEVTKLTRMQYSTEINPQQSKIHRGLVYKSSWETSFTKGQGDAAETKFLVGVAQCLDISTDKLGDDKSISELYSLLEHINFTEIADFIRYRTSENPASYITQAFPESLVSLVSNADSAGKALSAIFAYVDYLDTPDKSTFTHVVGSSADGIASGVSITHTQIPILDTTIPNALEQDLPTTLDSFKKFGLYTERDTLRDYYQDTLYEDAYTDFTTSLYADLQKRDSSVISQIESILQASVVDDTGRVTSAGRNFAKARVMTYMYQASVNTNAEHAYKLLIDSAYEILNEYNKKLFYVKNSIIEKTALINDIVSYLNIVDSTLGLVAPISRQDILDNKLRNVEILTSPETSTLKDTIKAALKATYDKQYGFITRMRNMQNALLDFSSKAYHEVVMRDISEQIVKNKEAYLKDNPTQTTVPRLFSNVTIKQYKDILEKHKDLKASVLPAMLYRSNELEKLSDSDKVDVGLMFGDIMLGYDSSDSNSKLTLNYKKSKIDTNSDSVITSDVGVSPSPLLTMSVDAAVNSHMLEKFDGVNIHDEFETSLPVGKDTSTIDYNKTWFEITKKYTISSEILDTIKRNVDYLNSLQDFELSSSALANLVFSFDLYPKKYPAKLETRQQKITFLIDALKNSTSEDKKAYITTALDRYSDVVTSNEYNKTKILDEVRAVNQYARGDDDTYFIDNSDTLFSTSNADALFNSKLYKDTYILYNSNISQLLQHLDNISEVKDSPQHSAYLDTLIKDKLSIANSQLRELRLNLGYSDVVENLGMYSNSEISIINQVLSDRYTSSSLVNKVKMSTKEVLAHELSHAISQFGINNSFRDRQKLQRLWSHAKKVITPSDLIESTVDKNSIDYKKAYQRAKLRWDYIFIPNKLDSNKNTQYLHEFVAFAETNKAFRDALDSKVTNFRDKKSYNLKQSNIKVTHVIAKFIQDTLRKIADLIKGGGYKVLTEELQAIVTKLAAIESKSRNVVKDNQSILSRVHDTINYLDSNISSYLKSGIEKLKETRNNVEFIQDLESKTRSKIRKYIKEDSSIAKLVDDLAIESKGVYPQIDKLYELKRKANHSIDVTRKQLQVDLTYSLHRMFDKVKFNEASESVLTDVYLRTDLISLDTDLDTTISLVTDDKLRKSTISKEYNKLLKHFTKSQVAFWYTRIKALADYNFTGISKIPQLMLNAYNIYYNFGVLLPRLEVSNAVAIEAINTIDKLITLHSLDYLDTDTKNEFLRLSEDRVGLDFVVSACKSVQDKMYKSFSGTESFVRKGYVAYIQDRNIDVLLTKSSREKELEVQGYTKILDNFNIDASSIFSSDKHSVFLNRYAGRAQLLAGAIHYHNESHAGTSIDELLNLTSSDPNIELMYDSAHYVYNNHYQDNAFKVLFDKNSTTNYAVPVVNAKGDIVDYRYTLDTKLLKDYEITSNNFGQLAGYALANFSIKDAVVENNLKIVQELATIYDKSKNKEDFILISPESFDPQIAEFARLLPAEIQEKAAQIFSVLSGGSFQNLLVHKDMMNLVFGYRRISIDSLWKNPEHELKAHQKIIKQIYTNLFGNDAFKRAKQTQDVLQYIASVTKDVLIIKTFAVTFKNWISNLVQLYNVGVRPSFIYDKMTEAYTASTQYKKDVRALNQLNLAANNYKEGTKQYDKALALREELRYKILNNPVHNVIQSGMLSSIIDDIEVGTDTSNVSSSTIADISDSTVFNSLKKVFDKEYLKTPKNILANVLILKNTETYQFLSDLSQQSDFVARYVLYKHLTENNQVNHNEAVNKAMDLFIDYDLHTNRGIDYLNNIGFLHFTKYFVRVQKAILNNIIEHPIRSLLISLFKSNIYDIPYIFESGIYNTNSFTSKFTDPINNTNILFKNNILSKIVN